jgi:hypothetical protein
MVFPYLKGFLLIKCGFFYLALWIYCVFSIYGYYIGRSIQVLNKWYQSQVKIIVIVQARIA